MARKIIIIILCAIQISCSSTGGIYDSTDSSNNEFSLGKTLLTFATAALVVSAARSGGGGGGSGSVYDYDWAWDQFYNKNYQLVWACRGKQTGQFAEIANCANKTQNDSTWPAK